MRRVVGAAVPLAFRRRHRGKLFGALGLALLAACSQNDDVVPPAMPSISGNRSTGGTGGSPADTAGAAGDMSGGASSGGTSPAVDPLCEGVVCERGACSADDGVPECSCLEGFGGTSGGCPDVNECLDSSLCGGGRCENTFGGFVCDCPVGFESDGTTCGDVDECVAFPCAEGAACTNEEGSFACECEAGTFGDGQFCKASDACTSNPCGTGSSCINTPTGYACQCKPGTAGSQSCAPACDVLALDSGLEQAVRAQIGKPSGALTWQDIQDVTTLDASGRDVTSLAGLDCWPHLVELDLSSTPMGAPEGPASPLAALASLNRLETLNLSCTPLTTLEGLRNHPSLRELVFDSSDAACEGELTSLSPLEAVFGLERLTIVGHPNLTTAAPLEDLHLLRTVRLEQNGLTTASGLGAPVLEELSLAVNAITDISDLSEAKFLRHLDVSYNELGSLGGVEALTRLEVLSASWNALTELPDLSKLSALRQFDAALNEIGSAAELATLPALRAIDLSANQLDSVQVFVDSRYVGVLSIGQNPKLCETEPELFDRLRTQGVDLHGACP